MIGEIDSGMEQYEKSVNEEYRSFVDLGNVRAMSRAKLPMELVEQLETHPRFTKLLEKEGISDAWRVELIRRLNKILGITAVLLRSDG